MITDRLDPPGILKIPEIVNVTVVSGSRIIHISGQTAVDSEGKVVGSTYLDQGRKTLENLLIALEAAGATLGDVAKLNDLRRQLQLGRIRRPDGGAEGRLR